MDESVADAPGLGSAIGVHPTSQVTSIEERDKTIVVSSPRKASRRHQENSEKVFHATSVPPLSGECTPEGGVVQQEYCDPEVGKSSESLSNIRQRTRHGVPSNSGTNMSEVTDILEALKCSAHRREWLSLSVDISRERVIESPFSHSLPASRGKSNPQTTRPKTSKTF
jgi:hypothetical protein